MRKTGITIFIALVLALFSFDNSFAGISDAGKYLKDNVIHKNLSNGINVLMLNRGYTPTLALLISFRAGSSDESYDTIGVAHMLEHMLFKGTDKIGTKDYKAEKKILKKIESAGGELDRLRLEDPESKEIAVLREKLKSLQKEHAKYVVSTPYSKIYTENGGVGFNASTSRDKTAYYIELPSSKMELWARLESERLRNPVLREFYLERGAVLEERLMRYDSVGSSNLFEKFNAAAFIAHPYRHPTIGWRSNIDNYTIETVSKFYRTYYIPSRMTITIVGKHDPGKTLKVLEKYFGRLGKKTAPPEVVIKEPEQKGERRLDVYFEASPHLYIGWHKPTFPSREDYVFDFVSAILSEGKTSRLYNSLVIEKGIALSINAWNGFPGARYNNLFVISAQPKHPHTPEDVEKAIYDEITRLQTDLKDEEIQKVLNRIESSFIFDLDSNMGIARLLSYYQTVFKDWKYSVDYLSVLKTISAKEIKDAIKKYLTDKNRTVGILRDSRSKG